MKKIQGIMNKIIEQKNCKCESYIIWQHNYLTKKYNIFSLNHWHYGHPIKSMINETLSSTDKKDKTKTK